MMFVYVDSRKGMEPIYAAMNWLRQNIGPESPETWFDVTVDNCDIYAIGNHNYRHMMHAWVIVDHEHATAFKLHFMSEPCNLKI